MTNHVHSTQDAPINQSIFNLDKLYIKDMSLEVPNAPQIFLQKEQPTIELNINYHTNRIDDGIFETVIHLIVNAKINNEQLFLIEIHQAGIFQIRNITDEHLIILQNVECPNAIFPYLRETVNNLTMRSGFMPIILAPINFAYLYNQKQQMQNSNTNISIN